MHVHQPDHRAISIEVDSLHTLKPMGLEQQQFSLVPGSYTENPAIPINQRNGSKDIDKVLRSPTGKGSRPIVLGFVPLPDIGKLCRSAKFKDSMSKAESYHPQAHLKIDRPPGELDPFPEALNIKRFLRVELLEGRADKH